MAEELIEGKRMYAFASKIFPFNRSITGEGVRQTLACIAEEIAPLGVELKIHAVPSGSPAFDWTVPKEWAVREAYIEDESGTHIIDMKECNLHVLGYSTPIDEWVDLEELKKHIYVEEEQPDVIPYVTSYYNPRYGFCMSKNQRDALKPGRYHMVIDSEQFDGVLNYGEAVIPGDTEEEILFSTYVCHPSLANNECSGPALVTELIRAIASMKTHRYTYRFVFGPETIGAITYLSREGKLEHLKKHLKAGFVVSCVGDDREYSMIPSRYGETLADRVLSRVLKYKENMKMYRFYDRGSDERQYNAPGVDLPVVCFCRSKFGTYLEYHTSDDNMDFVSPEGFQGAYDVLMEAVMILEHNARYRINVLCEPRLGKRNLYTDISRKGIWTWTLIWREVIAFCDGKNDLMDLSDHAEVPVTEVMRIIDTLMENDLLEKLPDE